MRRLLMAVLVLLAAITVSPVSAATLDFRATIKGEFGGASPDNPCPTDPTLLTCEVGSISGYGRVTQVFTFISAKPVDGCFEITGDVLWTLISDRESTFMTHEVYLNCTPGASAGSAGNRLHSFGNPGKGQGTFVITGGTSVFAGASGTGTLYFTGAGDAVVIRYDGTITI